MPSSSGPFSESEEDSRTRPRSGEAKKSIKRILLHVTASDVQEFRQLDVSQKLLTPGLRTYSKPHISRWLIAQTWLKRIIQRFPKCVFCYWQNDCQNVPLHETSAITTDLKERSAVISCFCYSTAGQENEHDRQSTQHDKTEWRVKPSRFQKNTKKF
jgi:hypothetical protein